MEFRNRAVYWIYLETGTYMGFMYKPRSTWDLETGLPTKEETSEVWFSSNCVLAFFLLSVQKKFLDSVFIGHPLRVGNP